MSRYEEACPYESRERASRCAPCTAAHNSLPPCVSAYLGGKVDLPVENVFSIRRIEVTGLRKAA